MEVYIGGYRVSTKVTDDHIVLTPPTFKALKEYRNMMERDGTRIQREGSRVERAADATTPPDKRSNDGKFNSDNVASVMVKLGRWEHSAGRLYYSQAKAAGIPYVAIIIPIAGFIVLVVVLSYVGLKLVTTIFIKTWCIDSS